MTFVEYINDPQDKPRSFHPKTVPSWVTNGGHWFDQDSETMIAIVPDDNIPEGAKTYTLEELQARQRGIQARYPVLVSHFDKDSGNMTDDQINTMIEDWVDNR